jgi:hypothetical protein
VWSWFEGRETRRNARDAIDVRVHHHITIHCLFYLPLKIPEASTRPIEMRFLTDCLKQTLLVIAYVPRLGTNDVVPEARGRWHRGHIVDQDGQSVGVHFTRAWPDALSFSAATGSACPDAEAASSA